MGVLKRVPEFRAPKISKDDPLFGVLTENDVGLDVVTGRSKIAKDVLDEMTNYLRGGEPPEKQVRIEKVRKLVWELADHPQGQKTFLRLK
ncbi:hypothetical protein V5N11_021769 [Cardamine amara subsp. amara]|uniref:Uncharacterized protein n=1 Tax=Cardamine amara subsp. amara TaxID=228776 RepID=A0ABD1BQR4_CARAN